MHEHFIDDYLKEHRREEAKRRESSLNDARRVIRRGGPSQTGSNSVRASGRARGVCLRIFNVASASPVRSLKVETEHIILRSYSGADAVPARFGFG
jgi:hypothetical protein